LQKLDNIDTEGLIGIQVAQLEKEKKETNERLRVISKRIDHLERAYRKEERPLLSQDYETQQKLDKETFDAIQRARRDTTRQVHQEDLATKARLSKMLQDYHSRGVVLTKKKQEEHGRKLEAANRKIAEEKEKRRKVITKQRQEEMDRREREEQARREEEAEEARKEAEGRAEEERKEAERFAEEERKRAEEEERLREAEEAKRKDEAEKTARREQRERERAEAADHALLQQNRQEEAEARRQARHLETTAPARVKEESTAWRRGQASTVLARDGPPSRSESPALGAAPPKYRPGAFAASGGWRTREAASGPTTRPVIGTPSSKSESPAPPQVKEKEETRKDEDGFQTVSTGRGVWKPKRGRA
jgi:translation initiation factor 3 subunit A